MSFLYLGAILFSLFGMVVLDHRFKLAFWHNPKRASFAVGIPTLLFIAWDILGIHLGIFWSGSPGITSGIMLGPEFPLEELFFLILLCYFTLNIYRLTERVWQPTS